MNIQKVKSKSGWVKPQLLVIQRTRPEESVLLFCKMGEAGQGPNGWFLGACFIDWTFQYCRAETNS